MKRYSYSIIAAFCGNLTKEPFCSVPMATSFEQPGNCRIFFGVTDFELNAIIVPKS